MRRQADAMATKFGTLATTYRAVTDKAQSALEMTLTERNLEEKALQEAIKLQGDLKAADAKARSQKESIIKQQRELQQRIDEAKAELNKAEDRALRRPWAAASRRSRLTRPLLPPSRWEPSQVVLAQRRGCHLARWRPGVTTADWIV